MPSVTVDTIHALIAEGEHQQQDFKFEISSACKIARSLSAFANTDGGRLLIGVKDNGGIAGVRSDEEMYMVEAAGEVYCQPPIHPRMTGYRVEGKTIVIAEIDPVMVRPVKAKLEDGTDRAFVRVADENIVASPVQMELWKAENTSGALICFSEEEHRLLQILSSAQGITLNRFCRLSHIPRHKAVTLLADFIRFGLVRQEFCEHTFVYVPVT